MILNAYVQEPQPGPPQTGLEPLLILKGAVRLVSPRAINPGPHNTGDYDASNPAKDDSGKVVLSIDENDAFLHCKIGAQRYGEGTIYLDSDPEEEKEQFPIDVRKKTDLWYTRYVRMLSYCGWTMDQIKWQKATGSFVMGDQIVNVLKDRVSPEIYKAVEDLMKAANSVDPNADEIRWFGTRSAGSNDGEFNINAVDKVGGNLTTSAFFASCVSDKEITKILWWTFKETEATMHWATNTWTLDWKVYKKREDWLFNGITAYLGDLKQWREK